MKQELLPAIRLTIVYIVLFCVVYPLLVLGIAQFAPAKGEGETIQRNGKTVGYVFEGQSFTSDHYFQGRPSAAGYNAAASAGSNKGPSDQDYLKTVSARIDSFLVHNPGIEKKDIPSELVTASGSGLDPDISAAAALVQVPRIAKVRNVDAAKLVSLIRANTNSSLLNGIRKVNVLSLNLALDQISVK
jgi:K+-transporting ATPase ATPase C chain